MSPSALFITTVPITLEAFLIPFAEHFRAQGWRVDALSNGATQHGPIYSTFDNRYDITWNRNPLSPSELFDTWARVRRVVVEGEYDVVHVHTPIAAFMSRYALRSLQGAGKPAVIYTTHGFHFYKGQGLLGHAAFRTLERTAAHWTDFIVTINEEDFEAARSFKGIPSENVRYVPGIGVDVETYESSHFPADEIRSVRDGLGVAPGDFLITMIAEFIPRKNHILALRAMSMVKTPDVKLNLVGTGPLQEELRQQAHEMGLGDRVIFAGFRRDIPAILAASDAGLLASKHEGLARSVLETMAAGRPVIGTTTRGIGDAIGPDAGWIVPRDDPRSLAAAIESAAGDPAEATRRGAAARERARAEFALHRIIEAYDALYEEALGLYATGAATS
jgi:glycosyltransferase involved in cell wall biosynthesis